MTYEYVCLACHHEWEAEQSISSEPLKECPECHELRAKRMVSGGAGFILKGGGWYADGYGSAGASKPSSTSEGGTTESKPAADAKKETKKPGDTAPSEPNSKDKSAST